MNFNIFYIEIRDDLVRKYGITKDDYNWIEQMVIENVPHKVITFND